MVAGRWEDGGDHGCAKRQDDGLVPTKGPIGRAIYTNKNMWKPDLAPISFFVFYNSFIKVGLMVWILRSWTHYTKVKFIDFCLDFDFSWKSVSISMILPLLLIPSWTHCYCLLITLDAHMFSHNRNGPGPISIMVEHMCIKPPRRLYKAPTDNTKPRKHYTNT